MKNLLILLSLLFQCQVSHCQLDKGTWLLGGTGSVRAEKSARANFGEPTILEKYRFLTLNLSLGKFVADKFVIGLKPFGSFITVKSSNTRRFSSIGVGPFVRYYLLPKEGNSNLLLESSYQFGESNFFSKKAKTVTFSASAGAVFFFNSNIGLEVLAGYSYRREFFAIEKGVDMKIGFQFHLQND